MEGISVIIPTLNKRLIFLLEAINSVRRQTLQPSEVIIVIDDKKSNCSYEFNTAQFNVLYTERDHAGASFARNLGVRHSRYKWLAFLDDDDFWLPGYLKSCLDKVTLNNANLVCASFLELKGGILKPEKKSPVDFKKADFFSTNPGFRGSNIFMKKSLFVSLKGFDENLKIFNDCDMGIRLKETASLKYAQIFDDLVVIRKHNFGRLSSFESTYVLSSAISFIKKHCERVTISEYIGFKIRLKKYWNLDIHKI